MRKLGLISSLLAGLLFFPLTGFALGLGEIEASSYLNQPLQAEIEVNSTRAGEIDDLLISLASRDAFAKAGLERPAGLSKLRFKVEKSEDGKTAKVLVSTKQPITEPFLSFLVEADWAKGRLLREFTVLLDPPSFAQQPVQVAPEQADLSQPEESIPEAEESTPIVNQPDMASVESEEASEQDSEATSPPEPIATDDPVISEQEQSEQDVPFESDTEYLNPAASSEDIVVSKGDTLWSLAAQFKDEEHSMAQVMLAMQMMNPDAFSKDNINNLKVGAVLRAPDMDAIERLSKQEAYAQVLDQNGLWDEYVARRSGVTTSPAMEGDSGEIGSDELQEDDGQLSLMTADGDSDNASLQNDANSEDAGQIRKQLALAEEELEAAKLENDDLKSRIEMLEEQQSKYDELQKLVQVEDNSLAQLQQNTASEDVVTDEISDDSSVVEDQTPKEETKPSDVMIEAANEMLETDTTKDAGISIDEVNDDALSSEAETIIPTTEETDDITSDDQVAPKTEAPAPAIITQPESSSEEGLQDMLPSMDDLLADPIMLGGIGAFMALLLGLVFLRRKKNSTIDEDGITLEEPDSLLDDDATPIHVLSDSFDSMDENEKTEIDHTQIDTISFDPEAEVMETLPTEEDDDEFLKTTIIAPAGNKDIGDEEFLKTEIIAPAGNIDVEEPAEQDDVLNEVDVYLAYGLYDNAEGLLAESLENKPERADYRAKLLDTLFATKNTASFIKEATILKSLGGAADRFWDRVQIMGFELAPENSLFSGAKNSDVSLEELEYAKPESADFDIGSENNTNDLLNTDFDLGVENTFEVSPTQEVSSLDDSFSETQSLDEALKNDLPDDISSNFDETMLNGLDADSDDDLSFDLPDDLDLSGDDESEALDFDDDDFSNHTMVVSTDDDFSNHTMVVSTDDLEIDKVETDGADVDISMDDDLDFDTLGTEDDSLEEDDFTPSDTLTLSDVSSMDDEISEFKPAGETDDFDAFIAEATDEDAIADVDASAGLESTGTFAPGDFENDISDFAELDDIDNIEDLMLPDDVDEVGTKLDLAKAFIDMGDEEGARSSLEEVLLEGSDEQKSEAIALLDQIN